jgi:predicted small lipoprotein YifL
VNPPFRLCLAAIGVLAAAALLTGCGRKGALDPPPGGWVIPAGPGTTPVTQKAGTAVEEYDADGKPIAPPGPKRRIPADWLID